MTALDASVAEAYAIESVLGKGSFGTVWSAVDRSDASAVALKRIEHAFGSVADAKATYREVVLLTKLKHRNVIALLDAVMSADLRDLHLVFELLDTDLHHAIRANVLSDDHRRYVAWQLLAALKYLHSAHVLHRDVKPSNVLLDAKARIRLADFGCARLLCDRGDNAAAAAAPSAARRMTAQVGALWYRAPELLLETDLHDAAVDVWSAGCVLVELFTGHRALAALADARALLAAQWQLVDAAFDDGASAWLDAVDGAALFERPPSGDGAQKTVTALLADCDDDVASMIGCMLRFAPDDRLSAHELLACAALARFHNEAREPAAAAPVQMPLREGAKYRAVDYRGAVFRHVIDKINLVRNRAALSPAPPQSDDAADSSSATDVSAAAAAAVPMTPPGSADGEKTKSSPSSSSSKKKKKPSTSLARRSSQLTAVLTASPSKTPEASPRTTESPRSLTPREQLEESLSASQKKALNRGVLLGAQRAIVSPRQSIKQKLTPHEALLVRLEELQVKRVSLEENMEALESSYGHGAKSREQLEMLMALGLQISDLNEQIAHTEAEMQRELAASGAGAKETGDGDGDDDDDDRRRRQQGRRFTEQATALRLAGEAAHSGADQAPVAPVFAADDQRARRGCARLAVRAAVGAGHAVELEAAGQGLGDTAHARRAAKDRASASRNPAVERQARMI
jgi:mitogen-activated protein kinase 15